MLHLQPRSCSAVCVPLAGSIPPGTRAPFPARLPRPRGHVAQGIFWGHESERPPRTTVQTTTHSQLQHLPLVPSKNVFQKLLTPLTSEELYRNICLSPNASSCPQHLLPLHELLCQPRPLSHADGWRPRGVTLRVCPAQLQPGAMDGVAGPSAGHGCHRAQSQHQARRAEQLR